MNHVVIVGKVKSCEEKQFGSEGKQYIAITLSVADSLKQRYHLIPCRLYGGLVNFVRELRVIPDDWLLVTGEIKNIRLQSGDYFTFINGSWCQRIEKRRPEIESPY